MASQRVESRADLGMRRSIKKQNGFSKQKKISRLRLSKQLCFIPFTFQAIMSASEPVRSARLVLERDLVAPLLEHRWAHSHEVRSCESGGDLYSRSALAGDGLGQL